MRSGSGAGHGASHFLPGRITVALAWAALLLGFGTYASDPLGFSRPELALYAMGSLVVMSALCLALPSMRRRAALASTLLVLAMFLYAELMTLATGLTGGPFVGLFALALWGAALSWRPWKVTLLAALTLALSELQSGFLDRMNDMHPITSAMVLLDGLGPAVAAAWIIVHLRRRHAPLEDPRAGIARSYQQEA